MSTHHNLIDMLLQGGMSQRQVAREVGCSRSVVRRRAAKLGPPPQEAEEPEVEAGVEAEADTGTSAEATLTYKELSRIRSLDDLLAFFKVDTDRWTVRDYRINKWEQASGNSSTGITITPLYQVRANLIRSLVDHEAELERLRAEVIADIAAHAPPAAPPPPPVHSIEEGVLAVVNVVDPHIGMLAWGKEVGAPYDTEIAVNDYHQAVTGLLRFAAAYPVARLVYVVGHDLMHADAVGQNARGGITTAGTPQDLDSRLERIRTAVRRATVKAIDQARTIAPVDVVCIPGNHDRASTYWLGEVLNAWYRNDDDVDVRYSAMKRRFYNFGKTTLMLTHGEEYKRRRDNLAMIFADECPADWWVASSGGAREILTGHNHVKLRGGYYPTGDVVESRGIRTRSLPGLTPEDSWHFEQGYHHKRAATLLCYSREGAVLGEHEFSL